jgi:hypothetical protein
MVNLCLVVEWSGFRMVKTSLDRCINKKGIKTIFLIIKWSRLEEDSIFGPVFEPFKNRTLKLSGK